MPDFFGKASGNFSSVSVCCVGMLTPRSDWSSHLEVGSTYAYIFASIVFEEWIHLFVQDSFSQGETVWSQPVQEFLGPVIG